MLITTQDQLADHRIVKTYGIVCMRFTTSTIMSGMAEFLAYGTAVQLEHGTKDN